MRYYFSDEDKENYYLFMQLGAKNLMELGTSYRNEGKNSINMVRGCMKYVLYRICTPTSYIPLTFDKQICLNGTDESSFSGDNASGYKVCTTSDIAKTLFPSFIND